MAISPRKRFAVLHRDGFTCSYCGRRPPRVVLHVDHIEPRAKGGSDDEDNLLAACIDCNQGKSDSQLQGFAELTKDEDSFQVVSAALSRFVAATYWVWAGAPITDEVRENIILAFCDGEGALLYHADLPETDGYYEMVKEHRETIAAALERKKRGED